MKLDEYDSENDEPIEMEPPSPPMKSKAKKHIKENKTKFDT
jgi:hypothetical protein